MLKTTITYVCLHPHVVCPLFVLTQDHTFCIFTSNPYKMPCSKVLKGRYISVGTIFNLSQRGIFSAIEQIELLENVAGYVYNADCRRPEKASTYKRLYISLIRLRWPKLDRTDLSGPMKHRDVIRLKLLKTRTD